MQHNLKGTNVDLTQEVRSYIDKKLGSLDKFLSNAAARVDVELEYLRNEEKTYRAELMLHDDVIVRAEARGNTLHEAIDKAAGELFAELTRGKKKRIRTLRHSAARVKEYLRGWRNKL